jgi:hypothetical protein
MNTLCRIAAVINRWEATLKNSLTFVPLGAALVLCGQVAHAQNWSLIDAKYSDKAWAARLSGSYLGPHRKVQQGRL